MRLITNTYAGGVHGKWAVDCMWGEKRETESDRGEQQAKMHDAYIACAPARACKRISCCMQRTSNLRIAILKEGAALCPAGEAVAAIGM